MIKSNELVRKDDDEYISVDWHYYQMQPFARLNGQILEFPSFSNCAARGTDDQKNDVENRNECSANKFHV